MKVFESLSAAICAEGSAALVTVVGAQGSAPRESGARMVVRPSGAFQGTIGGGALEWEAITRARDALTQGRGHAQRRTWLLGPQLGQCCGGRVDLMFETFDGRDLSAIEPLGRVEAQGPFATRTRVGADGRIVRAVAPSHGVDGVAEQADGSLIESFGEQATSLLLFGAGHVGRALVLALAPLPFRVRWVDPRPEAFPRFLPANVALTPSADPARELDDAAHGAFVLVMTHSHPLDLAIVSRALSLERFGYVGLIGSETKRARFLSQMRAAGLSEPALGRLTCPIGVPGIEGKAPAVIAAAVAAQLLQAQELSQ